MSVFSCIGCLFLFFFFFWFLTGWGVSQRMSSAQATRLPLCSFKRGLGEEELQKHWKAWEAAGDETTCLWNFKLLATNAPVWRAETLHRKCFSSLSMTDSANNVIPHLLVHVWARSNSQLSRLGLVQKACLKCSNSSRDSSGAARPAARLSSDTAAGQGAWSHTACRNSTFPSSSFVKKPKTGWDSMGRRILELLQRELSTGCCKAGSKRTYLYFLIPSLTGSDCSSHRRESKGCTTEWGMLAYMYFFQMSKASEPLWSHLNFNTLPMSQSFSPYLAFSGQRVGRLCAVVAAQASASPSTCALGPAYVCPTD